VFARFKPNRIIIRKLKINRVITSQVESESDLALDFSSFLLRYHKDLEYADFTEDNNVQDLIRRAEAFR